MIQNETLQKTLEHGRAKYAYECAEQGSKITKKKEYKSYVKKIPMLIKTNGLGAAFAFIKSKSNEGEDKRGYAYNIIYEQTSEWLKKEPKGLIADELNRPNADLVEIIISKNSSEYRALTNEVLAFFTWLKRFAEGLIEGEPDEEER